MESRPVEGRGAAGRKRLARLARRYRLGVITNFYGNAARLLAEEGLGPPLTTVVDSAIAGVNKPDPAIFHLALQDLGLPPERVPIGVDHYGNTSAASTLILLDEDRRAGRLHEGDLVVFLWVGAGNGAMNGYAALVI